MSVLARCPDCGDPVSLPTTRTTTHATRNHRGDVIKLDVESLGQGEHRCAASNVSQLPAPPERDTSARALLDEQPATEVTGL